MSDILSWLRGRKMGGERETVLESKPKPKTDAPDVQGSVGSTTGTRIRLHQSGNEVHFHDDVRDLKASVPVSDWWKAWDHLRSKGGTWQWIDLVNKTTLQVAITINSAVTTLISIEPAETDSNFRELDKFTKRK